MNPPHFLRSLGKSALPKHPSAVAAVPYTFKSTKYQLTMKIAELPHVSTPIADFSNTLDRLSIHRNGRLFYLQFVLDI